ncbi:MAG: hypothetical protein ACLGI6_13655 [Gammaproteobacteria bacterium]
MDTLSGIVSNISTSLTVTGGGDQQLSTTHIALFFLNGRQVKARSAEPLMIGEGDHIRVVGVTRRGVFHALAYHNLTRGVTDNEGWVMRMVAGSMALAMAVMVAYMFGFGPFAQIETEFGGDAVWKAVPLLLAAVFAAVGVYTLINGATIRQAARVLAQA